MRQCQWLPRGLGVPGRTLCSGWKRPRRPQLHSLAGGTRRHSDSAQGRSGWRGSKHHPGQPSERPECLVPELSSTATGTRRIVCLLVAGASRGLSARTRRRAPGPPRRGKLERSRLRLGGPSEQRGPADRRHCKECSAPAGARRCDGARALRRAASLAQSRHGRGSGISERHRDHLQHRGGRRKASAVGRVRHPGEVGVRALGASSRVCPASARAEYRAARRECALQPGRFDRRGSRDSHLGTSPARRG